MTSARPLYAAVLLALFLSVPASGEFGVCVDGFRNGDSLAEIEAFRRELGTNPKLRDSNRAAANAVTNALVEAMKGAGLDANTAKLIGDVSSLVENPIFDEALARSLQVGGIRKDESILAFQARLREATPEQQNSFVDMVVRQYDLLLEKAYGWADEERFERIGKRWGLDDVETYRILTRWTAGKISQEGELRLAILSWAKLADAEAIAREIKNLRRAPGVAKLTDAETVLFAQIKKPHYDQDLADNLGPISDAEFAWRMRLWRVLGWAQHKINFVRYPTESSFVVALSLVPVSIVHGLVKDWNLTNTVATIIGGIATCPPLVARMTSRAAFKSHDAIFLKFMTLKQISELGRFVKQHPKWAAEVGFADFGKLIDERVAELRRLRYRDRE